MIDCLKDMVGVSSEPAPKRVKTHAYESNGFSGNNDSSLEEEDEKVSLGSEGLIKRSEFIRIITDALISLGYHDVAEHLEKRSGIPLHNPIAKKFLQLVKNGEWDKSIDALHGFELKDDKSVRFFLLEQKFFDFLKIGNHVAALEILKDEMVPLGVNKKRIDELASELVSPSGDAEIVNKAIVLQKLLPPAVIIPEKRLECLLEKTLVRQRNNCGGFHNIPDTDLSLCGGHRCSHRKIPSVTLQILGEHTDEVWFVQFSHNGKYLASSSKDQSAIIWKMDAEKKLSRKYKLEGHEKAVVMVLWSPDDKQVITCGEEEVIRRWNAETGQCVHVYQRNGVASVSCGWFHDGSGIIGAMTDRSICLWNLDGAEIEHEQEQREQKQSDVVMTNDGKWIVSMSRDREISFFDTETKTVDRFKVIRDKDTITSFTLSKDSKYMLNNLSNEEITIWCIDDDEPYKYFQYTGHERRRFIIRSCFGGFEENFVASGSEDTQVYIWHRQDSEVPLRVLRGHSRTVKCVSWNPTDMHMLASASDDGTIRIWGLDKKLDGDVLITDDEDALVVMAYTGDMVFEYND